MKREDIDVVKVLGLADEEFAQAMLRMGGIGASLGDRDALHRLYAFVHADPEREAQLLQRLASLDAATRRQLLTPDRVAAVLPSLAADVLAEERPMVGAEAAQVLWFTGVDWVSTQVAHLRDWFAGRVEQLAALAARVEDASDSVMALRQVVLRSGREPAVYGAAEDLTEIPIVGSDLVGVEAGTRAALRLFAGPLTFRRVRIEGVPKSMPRPRGTPWQLQGTFQLEVGDAMPLVERGVGVLLVSRDPGLALSVTLERDQDLLRGVLDVCMALEDAPSALDRSRLEARLVRSPRNGRGGGR